MSIKDELDNAEKFCSLHLVECCRELTEFSSTGILVDGKTRELGGMLPTVLGSKVTAATNMVRRVAVEFVANNHGNISSWIDVKVSLPTPRKRVVVLVKNSYGKLWRTIAEYIPRFTVLAENFMDPDCDADAFDVNPADNQEYTPEGWWEAPLEPEENFRISCEVLCWSELPEVPEWARS